MHHKNKQSGFTMVEMLMTAAILGYALSVVLAGYVNNVALDEASRNLSSAVSHAEFVLEDIRNASFGSVATNITGGNWNWNTSTVTTKGLTALNSESIAATSSGTNPLDITVTVTWNDTHGRSRSRALKTTISG
jgi:prepilin-type N-terminal cleavage/methylation domain-containing protein